MTAAGLLIYLGRKIGPAVGYDLQFPADGSLSLSVPMLADELVAPELRAKFSPEQGSEHALTSLVVSAREPGHIVCRVGAVYVICPTKFDSSLANVAEAYLAQQMWSASRGNFRPRDASWMENCGSVLRIPVGAPLVIPIPPVSFDPDLLVVGTRPDIEAGIAALVHAAIAIPSPARDASTSGIEQALASLLFLRHQKPALS